MAYAEVEDVKSRAGRLRDAWDDTTPVTDSDLERFIRDAGATVDMALSAHGFTAPVIDVKVQAALTPVVADMALLMALTATWPGGNGPAAVGDAISEVRNRVEGKDGKGGYLAALADGQIGFLMYLRAQEDSDSTGANDFWSKERDYSSYIDDLQTGRIVMTGSGLVLRSPTGPSVHKDMKF